jgi:glycosyltransferase involved in cell wall biosynthesis
MKNVVLVNHRSQIPGASTGITRHTFCLLEALLNRDKFDFVLVTTWSKDRLPQKLRDGLARVVTVGRPRPYSWNIIRQIFENPAKTAGAKIILNVDQIGLLRGGKARVFIAHDLYFRAIPEALSVSDRLQQRYFIWPLMLKFNQRIACVSENTRNDVRKFYPAHGAKAVVTGAGSTLTGTAAEQPWPDELNKPYLLYVGNISLNKNIETLTRAMDLMAERGIDIRMVHVGRDDQGLLEYAASQMRFSPPPIRLPSVTDGMLLGLYANALCFVNTSVYEGYCLPVIEAQQAGTPVICSRTPAVAETAGRGAILFDPHSSSQLAERIQELIGDPQLRKDLQELGRQNAANHTWARAAERFENLFFELLGAAGP